MRRDPTASIVVAAVAAALFWLAYDGGTYTLASRTTTAIALLWGLALAVGLRLWPLAPPRLALVAGGALAGLAALTLLSVTWTASAERAFLEFDRVVLYLAAFALAGLGVSRRRAASVADAVALAIVGVGAVALLDRFFPGVFTQGELQTLLPTTYARLSYPVNYWNGLAALLALAFPLLLRVAVAGRSAGVRSLALAPLPALAAGIYLASSRGGAATAIVAVLAFAVLGRSWTAAAAAGLAAVGSALGIAAIHVWPGVVDPTRTDPVSGAEGTGSALLLALVCVGTGAAWGLASERARTFAPGRAAGRAIVAALATVAVAAVVLADPLQRFENFRKPPLKPTDVQSHFLSANGSGRWQFWASARDEWETRPLAGRGAGSYEAWWAQHGSLAEFVRDAHSLYLEQLGELGLLGFALVAVAFGAGILGGARHLREAPADARLLPAALLASFLAFCLGAGIDWLWELPVVSIVGMVLLGLLTGRALDGGGRRERSRLPHAAVAAVTVVGAVCLIVAQAIPLLASTKIRQSQDAAAAADTALALDRALEARDLEPWAASPYAQLAVVSEGARDYRDAIRWIVEAIERDREDWRLWLVKARIETKMGDVKEARRSLARARALNPRSPIFRREAR